MRKRRINPNTCENLKKRGGSIGEVIERDFNPDDVEWIDNSIKSVNDSEFGEGPEEEFSDDERRDSLLCFAREESECFIEVSIKTAASIIMKLAEEGMRAEELLNRVLSSSEEFIGDEEESFNYQNRLFSALYQVLEKDEKRRFELLDAVVALEEEEWSSAELDARFVAKHFAKAEDFEYLLKGHYGDLFSENTSFTSRLSTDSYWIKRVEWYIVSKRDWRRSWDEIQKAWRGFPVGQEKQLPNKIDFSLYRYRANKWIVASFVQQLFALMVKDGTIELLIDKDHILQNENTSVPAYEDKSRFGAPRFYRLSAPVAGFKIASEWCIKEGSFKEPYVFEEEGAMVLKIADHFRQEKNRAKRARWEKARKK
ncbi:MAG: hypothetical protein ABH881_02800 [bacterium]